MWKSREFEDIGPEVEEGKVYSRGELNAISDAILKEDARTELCRECETPGKETGHILKSVQAGGLILEFKEYKCPDKGHVWYEGEGKVKGIRGRNPILFEEHLHSRRRREIYANSGVPDPSVVSGLYNRTHPSGRKVNSPEQRRRHGASYYR
jgi:hypothetical protein